MQTKSMKLYEACLTLLQVYSKNNQSRKRSDATAEEDQYQDLLLIMELLTNLLSKEFIDFSDTGWLLSALNIKKEIFDHVLHLLEILISPHYSYCSR